MKTKCGKKTDFTELVSIYTVMVCGGYHYQNYGTTALLEFIRFMKNTYQMSKMTTTYIYGNEHAKHLYEKVGFTETDIVNDVDCHEVNMVYYC